MTTSGEPDLEEMRLRVAELRRAMEKAARRKDADEYGRLKEQHDKLKATYVDELHWQPIRASRARKAAEKAQEASRGPWRLPRGFSSPLAAERAREGRREGGPQVPYGGHLSPWMTGRWSPMQTRVWWP